YGANKEVSGRVDHVLRLHNAKGIERFFVDAPVGQGLGISQGQVGAVESRLLFILEHGRHGGRRGRTRIASLGQQLSRLGIAQSQCAGHAIQERTIGVTPDRIKILLGCIRHGADSLQPAQCLAAGGLSAGRLEAAGGDDLLAGRWRAVCPCRSSNEEPGQDESPERQASAHWFFPFAILLVTSKIFNCRWASSPSSFWMSGSLACSPLY